MIGPFLKKTIQDVYSHVVLRSHREPTPLDRTSHVKGDVWAVRRVRELPCEKLEFFEATRRRLVLAVLSSAAPKQDVAKAKALLAKAGYANGFTAALEYPSDVFLGGEDAALFAQKIQADLQAVGITINLTGPTGNIPHS